MGDRVKIGTPVFFDKRNPKLQFCSPGAGEVTHIEYGDRRSLLRVEITLDKKEEYESLKKYKHQDIQKTDKEELITAIQSGGLWACFIGYPFNVTPSPDERPPSIYVTLDNDEPHLPSSSVYLQDNIRSFEIFTETKRTEKEGRIISLMGWTLCLCTSPVLLTFLGLFLGLLGN